MPWINNPNIKAVVLAGLPGQESGNSLADVLFGDVNPSGKLVYTIAKNRADYSADVIYQANQLPVVYKEQLYVDYRWFDYKQIQPTFPFGFGLSYTTFKYSDLQIANNVGLGLSVQSQDGSIKKKPTGVQDTVLYKVVATISNVGPVDGEEVAQLYLAFPASAGEPPQILRGFDKVLVKKGETAQVVFYLSDIDISIYDESSRQWVIPSGQFQVLVGASSRDIRLRGSFSR
jgi:beta-glucosidase